MFRTEKLYVFQADLFNYLRNKLGFQTWFDKFVYFSEDSSYSQQKSILKLRNVIKK